MSLGSELDRLPIFPLPNVQLFPHALLPLHVFEPRYRALIKDCLEGNHVMAIATLEPGFEEDYEGRPPVKRVCGVGLLIGHEPLPDGRSNILVRGLSRAEIVKELAPDRAYRCVQARPLEDRIAQGLDRPAAVQTLVLLADRLADRLPSGGATLRGLVRSQPQLGPLADVLAAAIVTDPADRQRLLEDPDVAARVELVAARLAAIIAGLEGAGSPN
jgi:Lon protease-like protein